MTSSSVDDVVRLEEQVWAALVSGDAAADARLLADDFLGVYGSGFAGKADHTGQLAAGPTVAEYDLSDVTALELSTDLVLVAYRARSVPTGAAGPGEAQTMYVTSIWRRIGPTWRNIFSQDTAAER
jgi:hypothetical protein